jgi:ubiquitin C-terminal hydrolase
MSSDFNWLKKFNKITPPYEKERIFEPLPLEWTGNSCYLDSTLFAFFAGSESFINDLLEINLDERYYEMITNRCSENDYEDFEYKKSVLEELKKIGNSIRRTGEKVINCKKLRETLANCPDQEKYHEDVTGDAGAFLEYILGLLPVQKACKIIKVYGVHLSKTDSHYEDLDTEDFSLVDVEYDTNASIVHVIDNDIVKNINGDLISEFLTEIIDIHSNNSNFKRVITIENIIDAPYLIFSVERLGGTYSKPILSWNTIYPDAIIRLDNSDSKLFTLSAVVMHTGKNHYVAIAKYGEWWYYYDDMPKYSLIKYKSFNDIVDESYRNKKITNPLTHGTQYYYKPV